MIPFHIDTSPQQSELIIRAGLALGSQYSREQRFYGQHLLPPALDGHYVRARSTKRSKARTVRLPSVTQLVILLNTKWRNDATPRWNIINYRVLIFTQAAPPSPLISLCSAPLCTSLPCSISEASLDRREGCPRRSKMEVKKQRSTHARTLHTDPADPSAPVKLGDGCGNVNHKLFKPHLVCR